MRLNDTKCKNAKPFDPPSKSPKKLADGDGLYLWVYPDGAKRWRFDYRINGKRKVASFGIYPEVSLKDAREKKVAARKLITEGKDLSLENEKMKLLSTVNSENTFEVIAREWHENRKKRWKEPYADDIIWRLEKDIFTEIGNYPIKEIEPVLLLQVIRKIEKRGAHDLAKRQLQKCGEIFRYAVVTGRLDRDPSADIKEALQPVKGSHFASLEINELPLFIEAIERNDARLYQSTRNAIKLLMLTFVRTSELINATWDEINFESKEWIIPADRMKMGREHFVPLSSQSLSILKNQKELAGYWPYVFPGSFKSEKTMSNNTILGAIKRLVFHFN